MALSIINSTAALQAQTSFLMQAAAVGALNLRPATLIGDASSRLVRDLNGSISLIEKTPAEIAGEMLRAIVAKVSSFATSMWQRMPSFPSLADTNAQETDSIISSQAQTDRDALYVSIAEQLCETHGIAQIVNALLDGVFIGFEKHGIAMPSELRHKIRFSTGIRMESILKTTYVNKIVGLFKKHLSSLSVEELYEIVKHPTASADYSEVHRKFFKLEEASFLPIKPQIIGELMDAGSKLVNQKTILSEIHQIAINFHNLRNAVEMDDKDIPQAIQKSGYSQ